MRGPRFGGAVPALLLLLLLVLAAPRAAGSPGPAAAGGPGPLALTASLEPGMIRIGDAARLTVVADHPAGRTVELPGLERGRAIVVTDRKQETAALEDGRERTTFVVLLTSFEVGEHRIGPGEITFAPAGGTALPGAPLPGVTLRVRSLLAGADTPMRGAKEPVSWPAPVGRRAALAAALLALAAAAVLGARRLRARRRRRPAAGPPRVLPQDAALRALAALRASGPIAADRIEPAYRELSAIVRRYLEERFGLKAPERTTEEFIREAAGSGLLTLAHQELVRAFLEQCDLVKFARHLPAQDDVAEAIAAAERLIRDTRPPGAPAPGGKRVAER